MYGLVKIGYETIKHVSIDKYFKIFQQEPHHIIITFQLEKSYTKTA